MGYENRDYYREESYQGGQSSLPSFRFSQQSVIYSLIVLNVVIFLVDMFTPKIDGQEAHWLGEILALKTDRLWAIWNFLTYGFSHAPLDSQASFMHVGFNMLALFMLGRTVEHRLGKAEFLKFYLVAIVVSGIGWLIPRLFFAAPSAIVGASGAVSAVVIYFVFLNPQAKLLIWGIIPTPAWIVGALFLVANLSTAFRSTNVAWEAHLAGGAFGMLYYKLGWNFSGLQVPKLKSNDLKIHRPDSSDTDEKLQQEADRILKKISEEGESSLTRRELKTLNKYSKSIRKNRQ